MFSIKREAFGFICVFQTVFIAIAIVDCCYGVTLPPELQEYVDDLHKLCLDRSSLQEVDHVNYDINVKDQKMMCYMKCLMLESQWMLSDGTIDYAFIESTAHPEVKDLLMAAVNQCRKIEEGADLCEKSYNFNKCIHRADPENWFLV